MKRAALASIRFYQRRLSSGRPLSCRFEPTCSQYAYDAIDSRGVVAGVAMAARRLLRCNPLNDGGYDPVAPRTARQRHARHN